MLLDSALGNRSSNTNARVVPPDATERLIGRRSTFSDERAKLSRASTGERLPGEGWTDTQVMEYLVACFDRDTILDILLGYSAQWFPKRIVAITGRRAIQTFNQAGWPELDAVDLKELKRRRSILEHGAAVGEGLARGSAADVGLGPLFEELQLDVDTPVVSVPLPISGRPAIVLVGAPPAGDITDLEVICHAMGEQLETVIKMAKSDALPPEGDRIPPFPEPSVAASEPEEDSTQIGAPVPRVPGSFKERPQRRTLQSGEFDVPFADDPSKPRLQRPPAASHTQQLDVDEEDNAPRLGGRAAESDAEEAPPAEAGNPSATMFGLPAYPLGKKPEEKPAPAGDANSTMFGIPGTENLQFARKKSGVSVLPDRDLGDDVSDGKRTLMGGIEASRELVGKKGDEDLYYDPSVFKSEAELEAERQLEVDEPTSNPNKMTLRGGFEVSAMADALRREQEGDDEDSDLDDSRPLALEELEPQDDPDPTPIGTPGGDDRTGRTGRPAVIEKMETAASTPEPEPEAEEEAPKKSPPKAMILRPARKIRSKATARRDSSELQAAQIEDSEQDDDSSPVDYAAGPAPAGDNSISEVSDPPVELEPSTPSMTARGVGEIEERPVAERKPAADDDRLADAFDQFATSKRGDLYESSNHTSVGGGWAPEEPSDASVDDEPIDDAWLDYFAPEEDVAPETLSPQSEPRRAQAGPSTIPPEAIERIMDSGPHIVELQENFMMMDSRDEDRAFQAAADVAALGTEAIPVLELMFPGRLFIDRYQYTADTLPPVSEHGPILASLVAIGEPALYIARKFLNHGVIESRFYAVFLLTALPAESMIGDIFERLFDRDVQTRTVARKVILPLRRVDHFDSAILSPLRAELRTENDDSRIEIAAELLAEFRDVRAIENLLAVLGSYQGRANQSLHKALQKITLKSWSSPYEWRQWWATARDQKRETWMVEALNSPSDLIRGVVFDEVQRIPGLKLNYHPDQPAKLRERAQGELIEWFAGQVGRS